jgi:hypothetical protein
VYGLLATPEVALKFLTQPLSAFGTPTLNVGDTIAPFQVAVVDANGNIVPSAWSITISVAPGFVIVPVITGTLTQPCVNGIATFTGITPGTAAVFSLQAATPTLTPAISDPISVTGGRNGGAGTSAPPNVAGANSGGLPNVNPGRCIDIYLIF